MNRRSLMTGLAAAIATPAAPSTARVFEQAITTGTWSRPMPKPLGVVSFLIEAREHLVQLQFALSRQDLIKSPEFGEPDEQLLRRIVVRQRIARIDRLLDDCLLDQEDALAQLSEA